MECRSSPSPVSSFWNNVFVNKYKYTVRYLFEERRRKKKNNDLYKIKRSIRIATITRYCDFHIAIKITIVRKISSVRKIVIDRTIFRLQFDPSFLSELNSKLPLSIRQFLYKIIRLIIRTPEEHQEWFFHFSLSSSFSFSSFYSIYSSFDIIYHDIIQN